MSCEHNVLGAGRAHEYSTAIAIANSRRFMSPGASAVVSCEVSELVMQDVRGLLESGRTNNRRVASLNCDTVSQSGWNKTVVHEKCGSKARVISATLSVPPRIFSQDNVSAVFWNAKDVEGGARSKDNVALHLLSQKLANVTELPIVLREDSANISVDIEPPQLLNSIYVGPKGHGVDNTCINSARVGAEWFTTPNATQQSSQT